MQDAASVGVLDGLRHAPQQLRRPPGVKMLAVASEAAALDELHGEEGLPLVLADLVDGHDVRVVELGGGLGLGLEAPQVGRGGELAGENHFQGDDPVERRLPRLVDDAHAAAGDLFQQLVVAEQASETLCRFPLERLTPPGRGLIHRARPVCRPGRDRRRPVW